MRQRHRLELIEDQVSALRTRPQGWSKVEFDGARYMRFVLHPRGQRRPFLGRLDLLAYNQRPPSFQIVNSRTGKPPAVWPPGLRYPHAHPVTGEPWTCLRGLEEFHTHLLHEEDSWDIYRNNTTLRDIVHRIVNKASGIQG